MAFPSNFLEWHFVRFMDAYSDGQLKKVYADDIVLVPHTGADAARCWGIVNDRDDMRECDELYAKWQAYRAVTPPPIPENIVLGET